MTKHRLLITTLLAAVCALPLAGCGSSGQQITSDGITFQEDSNYPFVATEDCDAEDYVNRETDCGFPPSYKKKLKKSKNKVKKSTSKIVATPKAKAKTLNSTSATQAPVSQTPTLTKPKAKTGGFGSTSSKRRR